MQVKLISVTQPFDRQTVPEHPESLIAYCARVSSPNQDNPDYEALFKYLIDHNHWSPFEMVDMTVEITTSRAISPQILRHRSFVFQEFSQRFAEVQAVEKYKPRRQDVKNRQNSLDDLDDTNIAWFDEAQESIAKVGMGKYEEALERGIAKECARVLLPLGSQTRLYMKGPVRSWIHYLQVRTDASTQKEHRDIAEEIKKIFMEQFPVATKALGW
jgi:thymidylate synthase (FAD)